VGSLTGAIGKLSEELNKFAASGVSPNNELTGAATEDADVSGSGSGATVLLGGGNNSAIFASSNKS